ncbi:MAG: carbon-nitrogen hydrolase family protein [Lachnospiraceae bacterium]|jgi:hypothetical protein|nr:carbon-nitrogen hydrolase family protein [Lachnospiraceae bacterium]MCI9133123.1 carbon-nitrogen hydrolase family protein [Lachnospiraceae bacterium]
MEEIRRLYNIMAIALRKILNRMRERDFERLRYIEPSYENIILHGLREMFPQLYDQETRNVAELMERKLRDSPFISKLEVYIEETEDAEALVFLLRDLDAFLEDSIYRCRPLGQEIWRFMSLNDNAAACGLYILPRVRCNWEHNNRDAYNTYTMLYYLRNFYYVDIKNLEEFTVQHILLPQYMFQNVMKKEELRICVSPLTGENVVNVTEPYIWENEKLTAVKPLEPDAEQKIKAQVLRVLKEAVAQKAEILVFPEILGSREITQMISQELEERNQTLDNEYPKLTVCPSVWESRRNTCTVLDAMGEVLFEQQKHHGAGLKLNLDQELWVGKEDIISDNRIYVLHGRGIGRIAVAICKDFLMTRYLHVLVNVLKVNLLLVPSFSPRDYQFDTLLGKYAAQDWAVVWANTCSARWLGEPENMAAAVTRAYFSGKQGRFKEERFLESMCEKQYTCDGTCLHTYIWQEKEGIG